MLFLTALCTTGCSLFTPAVNYTESGSRKVESGDYTGALADFQRGINAGENLLLVYRGAGLAYMGAEEYDKAIEAFDEALENMEQGKKDVAVDILLYKSSLLFKTEQYEELISVCDQILELDSSNSDAYFLKGTCALRSGDLDEAAQNYESAVDHAKTDYDLYLDIYKEYEQIDQSAEGDLYLQKGLDIPDSSEKGHYNRGRIYYYLEQYDQAKNELQDFADIKHPRCLELMAKVYLEDGDIDESIDIYKELIEEEKDIAGSYNGLALCEISRENYQDALDYIKKGLEQEDTKAIKELRYNEIVAYEGLLDFATAKLKCGEFVARYPGDELGQKEYKFLESR